VNGYGPTENTTFSLTYEIKEITPGANIPIGRPLENRSACVLDEAGNMCPPGITGELCVGGAGLSAGYWNNPGLTAAKFIMHSTGGRLYRTGDLARWLPDGNIEFLGRRDDQVKLRGYRIELGEIEAVLQEVAGIQQAVVILREDEQGSRQLIAYVAASENYSREEALVYAAGKLPEYMVPSLLVTIEKIPLTPNGKTDRKKLSLFDISSAVTAIYTAPRNELEEQLVVIWQKLLDVERIGVYDNFFELGGHSLLAIRVIAAVRKDLEREIVIRDIFDHPTIAGLAKQLNGGSANLPVPEIKKATRPEYIPLSFSQERLWFLDRLQGSLQYHLLWAFNIKGRLNMAALEASFREIIERHEVLRTVIKEKDGIGYQEILSSATWKIKYTTEVAVLSASNSLQDFIEEQSLQPFDLSTDIRPRITLVKINEEEHLLIAVLHHIAFDGWSIPILVKELSEIYKNKLENKAVELKQISVQYADYAIWQRGYLSGGSITSKLQYWKDQLRDLEPLQLPTDYDRSLMQGVYGGVVYRQGTKELHRALTSLCLREGITLYMLLLTVFKVLLHRYSGQSDICVGSPTAGRQQQEVEGLIGFFINILPMRSQVQEHLSFRQLLKQVKQTTLQAYEHQEVPFEKVVEAAGVERSMSRNPLFQVLFTLQNTPESEPLKLGEAILTPIAMGGVTSQFDILLNVTESPNGLYYSFTYSKELYKADTVERMVDHYEQLLQAILLDMDTAVGKMRMLTAREEQQLLHEFNVTTISYPADQTVLDLFAMQVSKSPRATALVFEENSLTYQQLDVLSDKVAGFLSAKNIIADTPVGITMNSSMEMIICILAVLKAGGAYVPIDPGYPQERINYIINDSGCKLVLDQQLYEEALAYAGHMDKRTGHNASPQQLAYIIYTSGSTGRPKGVMIEHQSLLNYLLNSRELYATQEEACSGTYLHLSFSFDAAVTSIFLPLICGKRIVISSGSSINVFEEKNFRLYAPYDFIKLTPAHLLLLEHLMSGEVSELSKILVVGGEALQMNHISWLRGRHAGITVVNEYGPTETTVGCSTYSMVLSEGAATNGHNIPIGRPMKNVQLYIVDAAHQLAPVGVPGELCIGGVQLARGYLHEEVLTADKFIPHPFSREPEARVYKTGDRARWLPDGNIEFLGRRDEQVKIHGYRIELAEIEEVLQQAPGIKQAVVVVREVQSSVRQLIAFVVWEGTPDTEEAIRYIHNRLPKYMIPALLIPMEAIPLTRHGKTDRRKLSAMDVSASLTATYTTPHTETERLLCSIWQQLLEVESVGIYDDFFELGGHSLLAIRVVAAIRKELDREIAIKDIFDHPTVAGLAELLTKQDATNTIPLLKPLQRPAYIPLSFAQERLWLIDQLEGSVHYHVPMVLELQGAIDRNALEYALHAIVDRHEVLRTVIRVNENGEAFQLVKSSNDWRLAYVDAGFNDWKNNSKEILDAFILQPFDLSADYMMRSLLICRSSHHHILAVVLHHIASDGWSTSVLSAEFTELYQSRIRNRSANLAPLTIQYSDYACWQRKYLNPQVLGEHLDYWKTKLVDVQALNLPLDFSRPAIQSKKGAAYRFSIDKGRYDVLVQLCNQQSVTPFMTLLAAFNILLYRYCDQSDICIGTPAMNRMDRQLESMVGLFLNTIVIRSHVQEHASFAQFLQQTRTVSLEAFAHQEVPFEKVIEALNVERDFSRHPLFQVMFVMQNMPDVPDLQLGAVTVLPYDYTYAASKFDLVFTVAPSAGELTVVIHYCTDLFTADSIARMVQHYDNILSAVIDDPYQTIAGLKVIGAEERKQLLLDFNDTHFDYPENRTVIDLFEACVVRHPDNIAVKFGNNGITYRTLNDKANRLAYYLKEKGVKEGSPVPLCIERSVEMIIGLVSILKLGCAYLPIDPAYPPQRIGYMLDDVPGALILSTRNSRHVLQNQLTNIICIEEVMEEIDGRPVPDLRRTSGTDRLTYIIYTSGSTGRPKGIEMPDSALFNLLLWQQQQVENKFNRRILQFASINFDASFQEIFMSLCFGGTLFLIGEEQRKDVAELLSSIQNNRITHLFIPYVVLKSLAEGAAAMDVYPESLEEIFTAGEQLKLTDDIRRLCSQCNIKLQNYYGPSETHVVTSYEVADTDYRFRSLPPIGKPISNTTAYILNSSKNICGIGMIGELYIGGIQVAKGYLNRSSMTRERFIDDPFSEGGRLYRTGDLCRWLPDGNIQFLGRIDDQVKIRGYRVEPGEIEAALLNVGGVNKAVVLVKEDKSGNKRLIAYLVVNTAYSQTAAMQYLRSQLPEYMVPVALITLDGLPMTNNGKINKAALPVPDMQAIAGQEYVAPRTETERQLALIWLAALGIDRIGINDNFFVMGGHSLLAMRVALLASKALKADIGIRDIFMQPTIASLAAWLQHNSRLALLLPSIEAVERPLQIPLSFAQERLWFIDRLQGSGQYHLPWVFRLNGLLNVKALGDSFRGIVNRHEVLRTVIKENDGVGYQYILPVNTWQLLRVEEADIVASGQSLESYIEQQVLAPFNLSEDSMLRVILVKINDTEYVLIAVIHHIAFDGWSIATMVKELQELYSSNMTGRQPVLKPLPVQYADYACWQRNTLSEEALRSKLDYWKKQLKGLEPLVLPIDYDRPLKPGIRGSMVNKWLSKELSADLNALSQRAGATLYMTLLSVFKLMLYRYTGQADICVGSPTAGRQYQEIDGLMGFFINTLALRTDLSGCIRFRELLHRIKETTLNAYEHQEVPFEKIVEAVAVERDMLRNPLFQVLFSLQNAPDSGELNLGDVSLSRMQAGSITTQFDIILNVIETSGGLHLSFTYRSDLFRSETMMRMLDHYEQLLYAVSADMDVFIDRAKMLTVDEEWQLLQQFNKDVEAHHPGKTIISLFEEQVQETPSNTALVFGEEQLTYAELNSRANRLGRLLQSKGIKEESLVAILLDPSMDMIVAMLGILKTGAAYVPVDTHYPADRIQYLLEDSGCKLMITREGCRNLIPANTEIICLEKQATLLGTQQDENMATALQPSGLAYVIYTSGSTGLPKGVMIEHVNLLNYVLHGKNCYASQGTDGSGSFVHLSFSFDASITSLFVPLICGKSIVISRGRNLEVFEDENFARYAPYDFIKLTPAHLVLLKNAMDRFELQDPARRLVVGGEALQLQHIAFLDEHNIEVINEYGPTEATVGCSVYAALPGKEVITEGGCLSIGKPVNNTRLYITDINGVLAPIGVAGELCIGGMQVARGYLNQPGHTADKFIPDPFSGFMHTRLYKTGDLAKWLPDGNIAFLGRRDEQVKLHGYRIEPAEIEHVLQQAPGVRQAAVVIRGENDRRQLVAYLVAADDLSQDQVLAFASSKLPFYMIPSLLVALTEMPLTQHGKLDRKKLAALDIAVANAGTYAAPRTETEEKLAAIWQELLQVERAGIYDDFFELGGHSLLAIRVIAYIRTTFSLALPIHVLFELKTIETLAKYIELELAVSTIGQDTASDELLNI
jgi:amino acid adenylation domain-containing protein